MEKYKNYDWFRFEGVCAMCLCQQLAVYKVEGCDDFICSRHLDYSIRDEARLRKANFEAQSPPSVST
jgi:hypothetical protein